MDASARTIEDLQSLALNVRKTRLVRHLLTAVFGVMFGVNIGWLPAIVWLAANFACMWWGYFANRPLPPGESPRPGGRLNLFASVFVYSIIWTIMPVTYWLTEIPALQLTALVILASLLVFAQSQAFKSLVVVPAFGALPAAAFLVLPLSSAGYSLEFRLTIAFSVLMVLAYLAIDIRQTRSNAEALRRAQADLLEQKAEAVAANQAKTSFLAMMSHELRTPMNGVLGMAHALTMTDLDDLQARHVEMLVRSGGGLMTILNDILDISKIEAGRLELETIPFDLPELGQRACELWTEPASAKGVALVYDLDPACPQWLSGDPTRLRQIMLNLVSNALKFTSEGEVRLAIRALEVDGGVARLEIAVSDTGLGISEDQRAKLFQSFVQADVSTTRKFGGTGLGLSICKQLATLMGGDITLDSHEGVGSTFRVVVELPLAEPVTSEETENLQMGLGGLRVLVADDNAINLAVARAILESAGAVVATVGDGRDALDYLKNEVVDVVLLDLHMPIMNGLEALQRIRAGDTATPDIPIVALTADAMAGFDTRLLAQGFDAVEPKPINPGQLIQTVARLAAAVAPTQADRALAS